MIVIGIFLVLIFLELGVFGVLALLAWQKVEVFLTWNTRYTANEYEKTVTRPKHLKPSLPPVKTTQRGRAIVLTDEFVDINDMDFEKAYKAVAEVGEQ